MGSRRSRRSLANRATQGGWAVLCAVLWIAPMLCRASEAPDLARAEALISERRYPDARELAEEALRAGLSAERSLVWRWVIAQAYDLEGDHEEAAAAYASLRGDGSGPMRVDASLRNAKCLLRMWDAQEAVEILEELPASELGERAWERDELVAIAKFVGGKANESLALLEELPRKSDAGWHYLGLISFNSGEYRRAVGYFDRAVAAVPGDYYHRLYRASSLLELNELEKARSALLELLELAPTPEVHQILGRLELREESFARAEIHLRKALALSPGNVEAQFGLVTALRRQKKGEEARAALARFRELHGKQQEDLTRAYRLHQEHAARPRDPAPAEALARHHLAAADPAAAERMAWKALRVAPGREDARLSLARAYSMVGRFQEASVHYRKILRSNPENRQAEAELSELIRNHARRVDEEP